MFLRYFNQFISYQELFLTTLPSEAKIFNPLIGIHHNMKKCYIQFNYIII